MNHPLLKPRILTINEFRAMEAQAPAEERWELVNGVLIKSQAGGTVRHNDIVQNVALALRAKLKRVGSNCRTSTESVRLDIEDAAASVLPDVIVNCREPRGSRTAFSTAAMVVEVISPSTSNHDKIDKLEAYFTLPDLMHVLLIEQASMRVTVYARSAKGWLRQDHEHADDVVTLDDLGVELSLVEIYDEIDFDA